MNKNYVLIFILILMPFRVFCYEYHIQNEILTSGQQRLSLALSRELKVSQFTQMNNEPSKLLKGLLIHQIFVSYTGYKTVGVVFLANKKNIKYPEKMDISGATLFHFATKNSVMAVWLHGLSEQEKNRVYHILKTQTVAENQNIWSHLFPQAYAQTCDAKSQDALNPVVEKLNESGYSHCWGKLNEGVESYAESVVEDVKKKASMDFDLFGYWDKIKQVAGGVADFATNFFSNPVAWIQQNVPNAIDLDLSALADIDRHQMLGLACLAVGREGLSSLVSSVVRGPAGLGLKIFQMISKITSIGKRFTLLKKFGNLTAEKFAQMKDQLVKLAEKVIKGEHGEDKTDSIKGLMKMSPGMAQEGLACLVD